MASDTNESLHGHIEYDEREWKKDADGITSTMPGAKLKLTFEGTRIDLVSLKGQGVAGILIDGKKSSTMAGTWAATQPSKTPIDYRPAIRKVGIGGQPVAETWTLTADNISEDGKAFSFSLEGSVSGFQGRGDHTAPFVSMNGVQYIPYNYIRIAWRNRMLNMLVNFKIITKLQREDLKRRYPKGFIMHGVIKDTIHDRDVKLRLCQYMQRGLIGDKNIIYYNKNKNLVVIKYKYDNKPKFERMTVNEFIARIIQHIDSTAISTRYYGIYSNHLRHKWKQQGIKPNPDYKGVYKKKFSISWRKLIYKIWEIDPLICINCGTEMQIKFLVDVESAKWELKRIRKLKYYYLGRWTDHPPPHINVA